MACRGYLIPCSTSSTTFETELCHSVFLMCHPIMAWQVVEYRQLFTVCSATGYCNLESYTSFSVCPSIRWREMTVLWCNANFISCLRLYITALSAERRPHLGNGPELRINRCNCGLCVTNARTYKSSCSIIAFLPSELFRWQQQVRI